MFLFLSTWFLTLVIGACLGTVTYLVGYLLLEAVVLPVARSVSWHIWALRCAGNGSVSAWWNSPSDDGLSRMTHTKWVCFVVVVRHFIILIPDMLFANSRGVRYERGEHWWRGPFDHSQMR